MDMTNYAIKHKGNVYLPDGKADIRSDQVDEHNQALEQAELVEWSKQPDSFVAYASKDSVTTWLGTKIGSIVRSKHYSSNLSRNMRAITVRGTNGAIYYGRYGSDWSQLVRLRKSKRETIHRKKYETKLAMNPW